MRTPSSSTIAATTALVVLAGMLIPAAASGAGRADLAAARPAKLPKTVNAGVPFRATWAVRNKGGAKARRSTGVLLLSKNKRRDRRDVKVRAKFAVGTLGAGRRSRRRVRVVAPLSVKPGRYYLLACADARRKVRERSEGNNCAASKRRLRVRNRQYLPPFKPRPQNVAPSLDTARAVTRRVTSDGGTLVTTGRDGTRYTLSLPRNALVDPEEITMTPIAAVGGLPFSGGLGGGVQLAPDGLTLSAPAKLVIDPPADAPLPERTAFSYLADGKDFHLHPSSLEPGTVEFDLLHFSAYGWGKATEQDKAAQTKRVPSKREAWAKQNLARALSEARFRELIGADDESDRWRSASLIAYFVWGNESVREIVTAATTNDALINDASRDYFSWSRFGQITGLEGTYPALDAELKALFDKAFEFASKRASERCVQNKDPFQGTRMISIERTRQLFGHPSDEALNERVDRCLRFELEIHFKFAFDFEEGNLWDSGVDEGDVRFELRPYANGVMSTPEPVNGKTTLNTATLVGETSDDRWMWTHTEERKPAAVRKLDIDFRTAAGDGAPLEPKVELTLDWADLAEWGTWTSCSEGADCEVVGSIPSAVNALALNALYINEAGQGGMTVIRDWKLETGAGNEVFATKERSRSRYGDMVMGTGTEDIRLRLLHKPVSGG